MPNDLLDLDEVDRTLLRLLRADGRMPNARLAEEAGIAPSTCVTRVRRLIERGVIAGFTAIVPPASLGRRLEALISVSIRSGGRQQNITAFGDRVRSLPEVVQLFFLGGAEDFIVHVAVPGTEELRAFVLTHLSGDPAVASTRTSVVFDHIAPTA